MNMNPILVRKLASIHSHSICNNNDLFAAAAAAIILSLPRNSNFASISPFVRTISLR